MLLVKRYNAELARINVNDGQDAFTFDDGRKLGKSELDSADGKSAYTRASGGPYRVSKHFEAERWRRT